MPAFSQLLRSTIASTHRAKRPCRLGLTSCLVVTSVLLAACNQSPSTESKEATSQSQDPKQNLDTFIGCYTVSYDEPAQIKVSVQSGEFIMQMKEPARANRIWDDPEPLEAIPLTKVRKFFSIDPNNVDAMLARPDRVLVLAHVKSAYANIDPLLDSEYLSYIYRGANTIYKVDCDEVNTDILADPHANIAIKQVEKPMGE